MKLCILFKLFQTRPLPPKSLDPKIKVTFLIMPCTYYILSSKWHTIKFGLGSDPLPPPFRQKTYFLFLFCYGRLPKIKFLSRKPATQKLVTRLFTANKNMIRYRQTERGATLWRASVGVWTLKFFFEILNYLIQFH